MSFYGLHEICLGLCHLLWPYSLSGYISNTWLINRHSWCFTTTTFTTVRSRWICEWSGRWSYWWKVICKNVFQAKHESFQFYFSLRTTGQYFEEKEAAANGGVHYSLQCLIPLLPSLILSIKHQTLFEKILSNSLLFTVFLDLNVVWDRWWSVKQNVIFTLDI